MTTAHRPTFDPAVGREALRGPAYHQRLQPAHTALKVRQPGQGNTEDTQRRDLRTQLLEAEAKHYKKSIGGSANTEEYEDDTASNQAKDPKGLLQEHAHGEDTAPDGEETIEEKRRRVLEATREIDADDDDDEDEDSSEDESDDDEDETAELMRELEKIKRERAEQRGKEEMEKAAKEQEQREKDIAYGNPLLNPKKDFGVKRRWDDDVVFKNQGRGTETKRKPEFVNDLLRSDFHKRFMNKYVR